MKASDITDEQFFEALNEDGTVTMLCELEERLDYPRKVILAKARTLIRKRRGLDGCYCGCRGDFVKVLSKAELLGPGGIVVDGLYVPPIGLFGIKNFGELVWGERGGESDPSSTT